MANFNKLKEEYPDIKIHDAIEYDGKIYVTYQYLSAYFGVGVEAVKKWVQKRGMEKDKALSRRNTPLFDFKYVMDWHKKNIATSPISKAHADQEEDDMEEMSYLEGFNELSALDKKAFLRSNKDPLDRIKVLGDITLNRTKLDKERGQLIDKEEVAITISEYIGMLMSQIKMDLRIFPSELEKKTPQEISEYLEPHWESTLGVLREIFTDHHGGDTRVVAVFSSLGELLNHFSVEEINEKLIQIIKDSE